MNILIKIFNFPKKYYSINKNVRFCIDIFLYFIITYLEILILYLTGEIEE